MKQYLSVSEFLQDMPELARPRQSVLQDYDNIFRITTDEGTDAYIVVENGIVSVQDTCENPPIAVLSGPEAKLLTVINKPSAAMQTLLFGGVHVRGDVRPLLKMAKLL